MSLTLTGAGPSGSGVVPFVGPLDDYVTDVNGVWSENERLLVSWTGALIRIRCDATELDINPDASGDLDVAAIAAFATEDCFLVTVYDQSGSGHHRTQTVAASQPLIYDFDTTTVQGIGGKVAGFYDGVNDSLATANAVQPVGVMLASRNTHPQPNFISFILVSATNEGAMLELDLGTPGLRFRFLNNSAPAQYNMGDVPAGWVCYEMHYENAGAAIVAVNGTDTAVVPQGQFENAIWWTGAAADGSWPVLGYQPTMIYFNRYMTPSERSDIRTALGI